MTASAGIICSIIISLLVVNNNICAGCGRSVKTRYKRVTEIDYQLKHAIFSTACSVVYKYCTRPISKHLYSGILRILSIRNTKSSKKKTEFINVLFHV